MTPRSQLLSVAMTAASLLALACGAQPTTEASRDPAACATCHLNDFQSAKHHVGEKPTTCGVCHAQAGWHPQRLEHPFWELTGAHAKANCFYCHEGTPPAFKGTSKVCVSCHRPEYEKAPNHVGHRPTTCEDCHRTDAWKPTLPKVDGSAGPEPSIEPEPVPSAVPSSAVPPAPKAKPKPAPTPKPKPPATPTPTPTSPATAPPTSAPTTPPPDTVTGPSKRKR